MSTPPSENPTVTAARWLANQPAGNPRIISELRERFGLSPVQACEAIALARAPGKGSER